MRAYVVSHARRNFPVGTGNLVEAHVICRSPRAPVPAAPSIGARRMEGRESRRVSGYPSVTSRVFPPCVANHSERVTTAHPSQE